MRSNFISALIILFAASSTLGFVDCEKRVPESKYGWGTYYACLSLQREKSTFEELARDSERLIAEFDPNKQLLATQVISGLLAEGAPLANSVKVIERIGNDFKAAQKLLRAPGHWKMCPQEIFRECTVIALSIDDKDPAGRMLDGKPQQPFFRYRGAPDQLDLLIAFAMKAIPLPKNAEASDWLLRLKSKISSHAEELARYDENQKKLNSLMSEKIRPAAQALVDQLSPAETSTK